MVHFDTTHPSGSISPIRSGQVCAAEGAAGGGEEEDRGAGYRRFPEDRGRGCLPQRSQVEGYVYSNSELTFFPNFSNFSNRFSEKNYSTIFVARSQGHLRIYGV